MTITEKYKDYRKSHFWLYRHFGKADHCSNDLSHAGTFQWANTTGVYAKDIKNFRQLCRSCHAKLDYSEYQREYHRKRMTGNTLRRKTVVQLNKNGDAIKEFPTLKDAAAEIGVVPTALSNCLAGKSRSAGGFRWAYGGVS